MLILKLVGIAAVITVTSYANAAPPKNLAYPVGEPSAEEIAKQVYFVNHFYAVQNVSFERQGKSKITVLAMRKKDGKTRINSFRRFLNNAYKKGESPFKARDLALFHSGKLRGTGILVTEYADPSLRQSYKIWLPALRKIRNFTEPPHDDVWGGSDLTYGDVYLREPEHETHELTGKQTFSDCLGTMTLSPKEKNKPYLRTLPDSQCEHKGKTVYKLKSATKFKDWWYDHRISYVDTKTFADYRTDYFKNGKMVKRIDRDWTAMAIEEDSDLKDESRAIFWRYWYAKTYATEHETMISVPGEIVRWNRDMENEFWSEETMRSLRK
jgi:hypothetical protein